MWTMKPYTVVSVKTAPHGFMVQGPMFVLDVFEPDVLTMSYEDSGVVYQTFQPDQWQEATMETADGVFLSGFQNQSYQRQCADRVAAAKGDSHGKDSAA